MKTLLTFLLLSAAVIPAQAFELNRATYQSEVRTAGGTRLGILITRDMLSVPRFCGIDVTRIVFAEVDQAIADSKNKSSEQVKEIVKTNFMNSLDRILKLGSSSDCKDNVTRLFISVSEGLDRGSSAIIAFARSETSK